MKITKRQLKRIIKEEKRRILKEGMHGMDTKNALEFAISEYVAARVTEGQTDPSAIYREIVQMLDDYLADADFGGSIDTSRY